MGSRYDEREELLEEVFLIARSALTELLIKSPQEDVTQALAEKIAAVDNFDRAQKEND